MSTHREIVENMPATMRIRPRNEQGYPVPWFVPHNPETGTWDFRYMGPDKIEQAIQRSLCWTCGGKMVAHPVAFVVGPMCAVNRTSAEPPSHVECAIYAAKACPFLARPKMERPSGASGVVKGTEEKPIAGIALMRNPGAALVWITNTPSYITALKLFDLGDPVRVRWFAHSRKATHEEVMESISTGLPHLEKLAHEEGPDAEAALAVQVEEALKLVPVP